METVDMDIWKFLTFHQNLEVWNLRPDFPSEGHMWNMQVICSGEKSIYGKYRPYISQKQSGGPGQSGGPLVTDEKVCTFLGVSSDAEVMLDMGPYFLW